MKWHKEVKSTWEGLVIITGASAIPHRLLLEPFHVVLGPVVFQTAVHCYFAVIYFKQLFPS